MQIIVQKFGGTSVADIDRIKAVAELVKAEREHGNRVVVIVSAMAGVTNSLIAQCCKLSGLDERLALAEYDTAIASGEIVTASLLALQLQTIGIRAKSFQGWQIPILTNDSYSNSQVMEVNSTKIKHLLKVNTVPVITGFQGVSQDGNITTLGKGGSDTSAAIIAAAIKADRCDIYTDVDGIYTADPRIVNNARKINSIDPDQLYELCISGAKVLHPRAALAVKRYNFTLRILSSFEKSKGTITEKIENMEDTNLTAITSDKNLLKIIVTLNKCRPADIISAFSREHIPIANVNGYNQNQAVIIASLLDHNKCLKSLENLKTNMILSDYSVTANISSVTVVGYGIKNNVYFIEEIFNLLNKNNIEIFSADISDIKISFIVNDQDNEKIIKLLHEYYFE